VSGTYASVFAPDPERWGLRGDPHVWWQLRDVLGPRPLPPTADEAMAVITAAFRDVVGCDADDRTHEDDRVFRKELDHGGMSGGWVDLATWRDRLLPELEARVRTQLAPSVRIGNVVFDAPAPGGDLTVYGAVAGAAADLYSELLGMRRCSRADYDREAGWPADDGDALDPLVLTDDPARPNLAFEPATDGYEPPRWPDPSRPQQLHLDIGVADLDAAELVVLRHGGERLLDAGDHRTYADPIGHPFCLYPCGDGRIVRIVVDGPDPDALRRFYDGLFDGESVPPLAFQRVEDHRRPTWPEPGQRQQLHLDLGVTDQESAHARAARLGAVRLTYLGGGHVFADPAGHPFCLGE
jgi:hypothetical protein